MELLKFIRLVDLKENDFAVSICLTWKLINQVHKQIKKQSQNSEKIDKIRTNKTTLCSSEYLLASL